MPKSSISDCGIPTAFGHAGGRPGKYLLKRRLKLLLAIQLQGGLELVDEVVDRSSILEVQTFCRPIHRVACVRAWARQRI